MEIIIIIGFIAFAAGIILGYSFGNYNGRKSNGFIQEKLDMKQREYDQLLRSCDGLRSDAEVLSMRAVKAESANEFLRTEQDKFHILQDQYQTREKELATLRTKLEQTQEYLERHKEEVRVMQEQNRNEFRNMAQEILEQKQKTFAESNEKNMQNLLNPLKEQIGDFKRKVEEVYIEESKERHKLEGEIRRLVETSSKVGEEANNLTNALKTNVKMQGNWGEMILETILSGSGLTKDREFFVQQYIRDKAGNVIKDVNGHALQPDVTILYPDQRKVIADSKVSLVAWERYVNASDPDEQKAQLSAHIASIYAHIDGLSAKNYPKYAEALDYVLMFVPIEPAFLEALKTDRELWKYAYDKGIVMVSPTNLLAVLKIIADLWEVEKQSKHAIDIAERAGALYDKFCGFVENMESIGDSLKAGQKAYDNAFKQLGTGKGNIIRSIEELKKKGAKAKKQLSDEILKMAETDEIDEAEEG